MASPQPHLERAPKGQVSLIDVDGRRPVPSGLLAAALEQTFGTITDSTASPGADGPPVEVLQGPSGPPFVVVNGQRLPLRGLPLPQRVDADSLGELPAGPTLDVAAANVPRARLDQLTTDRRRRAKPSSSTLEMAARRADRGARKVARKARHTLRRVR